MPDDEKYFGFSHRKSRSEKIFVGVRNETFMLTKWNHLFYPAGLRMFAVGGNTYNFAVFTHFQQFSPWNILSGQRLFRKEHVRIIILGDRECRYPESSKFTTKFYCWIIRGLSSPQIAGMVKNNKGGWRRSLSSATKVGQSLGNSGLRVHKAVRGGATQVYMMHGIAAFALEKLR